MPMMMSNMTPNPNRSFVAIFRFLNHCIVASPQSRRLLARTPWLHRACQRNFPGVAEADEVLMRIDDLTQGGSLKVLLTSSTPPISASAQRTYALCVRQ
jgi:hypothetical protein